MYRARHREWKSEIDIGRCRERIGEMEIEGVGVEEIVCERKIMLCSR
jgi:hypothetical protein